MNEEELNRLSYAILQSTSRFGLEKAVIDFMREGWTVSGGVSVTRDSNGNFEYHQAVVRT